MKTDYYPWNIRALTDWLSLELTNEHKAEALAALLQMSPRALAGWVTCYAPKLTLRHLYALAQYREASLQQTIQWLDLKPAHVRDLITEDSLGDEVNWEEAKQLWFNSPA